MEFIKVSVLVIHKNTQIERVGESGSLGRFLKNEPITSVPSSSIMLVFIFATLAPKRQSAES